MKEPVVTFTHVSKTYRLFKKKSDLLLDMASINKDKKEFSALSDVSFEVYGGETIGIIGVNGSGKSTLSNLLAQIVPPTSGEIDIKGETTLVAISAGMNNHLSGLENIRLKCLMHGMKEEEIVRVTEEIIEFADIGDFIKQPIKSYSTGMKARLGFAISIHNDPDILIIDEALSVGDQTFYQKCLDAFADYKARGKTIFFISHSLDQVLSISDRILWLSFGQVEAFDEADETAKKYSEFINWFNDLSNEEKKAYRDKKLSNQISNKSAETNVREKKRQKGGYFLSMQVAVVLMCFLVSALVMFIDSPVELIEEIFNRDWMASDTTE